MRSETNVACGRCSGDRSGGPGTGGKKVRELDGSAAGDGTGEIPGSIPGGESGIPRESLSGRDAYGSRSVLTLNQTYFENRRSDLLALRHARTQKPWVGRFECAYGVTCPPWPRGRGLEKGLPLLKITQCEERCYVKHLV